MVNNGSPGENWILVVDDEPAIRELMQSALEMVGHKVDAASGGAQALEMQGRIREAVEQLQTALSVQKDFEYKDDADQLLRKLKGN